MSRWVIKFRRPMRPLDKMDDKAFGRCVTDWVPIDHSIAYRVRCHYWDAKYKMWTTTSDMAYLYKTREAAEKTAFKLIARDGSLIGELEVVEATPPQKKSHSWTVKP